MEGSYGKEGLRHTFSPGVRIMSSLSEHGRFPRQCSPCIPGQRQVNPCRTCRKSDTLIALRDLKNTFCLLYLRRPPIKPPSRPVACPSSRVTEFVSSGARCSAMVAKIWRQPFSVSPFPESLLYFPQGRSLSAKKVSFRYPSVFLPVGRGKGRTRHDVGIHVTRRGALHGLHPERYVRPSVRPERVPPPSGPLKFLIR